MKERRPATVQENPTDLIGETRDGAPLVSISRTGRLATRIDEYRRSLTLRDAPRGSGLDHAPLNDACVPDLCRRSPCDLQGHEIAGEMSLFGAIRRRPAMKGWRLHTTQRSMPFAGRLKISRRRGKASTIREVKGGHAHRRAAGTTGQIEIAVRTGK